MRASRLRPVRRDQGEASRTRSRSWCCSACFGRSCTTCAGVRYLFLDIDKGVDLPTARMTSGAVLAVSLVLTAVLGGWLLW
jgi:hypothetical protein